MKQKRYWLKVGGIGLLMALLLVGISMLRLPCPHFMELQISSFGGQSICGYVRFLNPLVSHYPLDRIFDRWPPLFLILVGLGIIVGWLYGKIKTRKIDIV